MDGQLLEQFVVGFVRGPHGLSGEFKVESASGRFDHFYGMTEVALRNGKTGESRTFRVQAVDSGDRDLYMKLIGIDTPEDVRKFVRWEIVVPRGNACPLGEDEWYVEDLKRCSLVYRPKDGEKGGEDGLVVVGTITDVMEGGSGDLLEVSLAENCGILTDAMRYGTDEDGRILYRRKENGKARTVYVPLKREAGLVGKVDIEGRTVELMHLWILE